MRSIRSQDTVPEMVVRRLVHGMGYRFRLHRSDLPGTPDLVLPRLHKVVLVHGCFWHRHSCGRGRSTPATRTQFWTEKFEANIRRDRRVRRQLRTLSWQVFVAWECQTSSLRLDTLTERLARFLEA